VVESDTDDLAAGAHGVELAHRDDALDLFDEVVLGNADRVAGGRPPSWRLRRVLSG
jgi:hypothetical protein